MKEFWHVLYHGTTKENMESILKNGFYQWTYFAKDLSSALKYGGLYVFDVVFPHSYAPLWFKSEIDWQIRCREVIPVTRIVRLRKFEIEMLQENEELREEIFQRALPYYRRGHI